MDLVYDIYAVFEKRGGEADLVLEVTDVINAVITCGVHLYNVGSDTAVDGSAGLTPVTGVAVSGILAVYGLGKYLCAAGLTRSARASEKISVRDLVICDLIFKNIGDPILSADVIKVNGTPFAV